jgi:hypothetical protein
LATLAAMQISAANLLLASQQTRPATPARMPGAEAQASGQAKQAAKAFALPDFDQVADAGEVPADTPRAAAPRQGSAPAPVTHAQGYASALPPGSTLDIRV